MEYCTRETVHPCRSGVQVGQPALMDGFQTQTNSQITTIIGVHLVATAVCHGIAGLFETLILLVNIQTFFAESLELVQSSTKFLFNLRNRRMLQLQHTGKVSPRGGCRVSPSPAVEDSLSQSAAAEAPSRCSHVVEKAPQQQHFCDSRSLDLWGWGWGSDLAVHATVDFLILIRKCVLAFRGVLWLLFPPNDRDLCQFQQLLTSPKNPVKQS